MIITLVVVICLDVINDPVLLDLPSLVVVAFGICAAEFELPVEPLLEITAMGDKECIHRVEKEGDLVFFSFFFLFFFFFFFFFFSLSFVRDSSEHKESKRENVGGSQREVHGKGVGL